MNASLYDYFMAQAERCAMIAETYRTYGPARMAKGFEDAAARMARRALAALEGAQ